MKAIGPKLVIATHNAGKLREIQELLAPYDIECVGAAELGLPEPEEIGNTFVDNADLKAREAADLAGLPALGGRQRHLSRRTARPAGHLLRPLGRGRRRQSRFRPGNGAGLARSRGSRATKLAMTPISPAR